MRIINHHRFLLVIFFSLALGGAVTALAQSTADRLSALTVDLWPDYDRPAMLILLTGELPDGASLPATLTIPLPDDAELNAVARFGETGELLSDVEYTLENGQLTFTTPSPRFRVEYYVPYQVDGNTHRYQFDWQSDLTIDALTTIVQQPLAAENLVIEPEPAGSELRTDNLTYFTISSQAVSSGQTYSVRVSYQMSAPQLSAESAATPNSSEVQTVSPTSRAIGLWIVGLLVMAALVGGAFYLGRNSAGSNRKTKPRPARPEKPAAPKPPAAAAIGRFCHNCGRAAEKGDTFCRDCGTRLKT